VEISQNCCSVRLPLANVLQKIFPWFHAKNDVKQERFRRDGTTIERVISSTQGLPLIDLLKEETKEPTRDLVKVIFTLSSQSHLFIFLENEIRSETGWSHPELHDLSLSDFAGPSWRDDDNAFRNVQETARIYDLDYAAPGFGCISFSLVSSPHESIHIVEPVETQ
jgi:hypothetical protein